MHTYAGGHMDGNGVSSKLFEYHQLYEVQNSLKGQKEAVLHFQLEIIFKTHFVQSQSFGQAHY